MVFAVFLGGCQSTPVATPPRVLGASVQGRPIVASTHGSGPRRIYVIGGIHGDEPEGLAAVSEIQRTFSSSPFRHRVTLRLLHDLNPDGTLAGTRTSSREVDLNRNWPASNFAPGSGRGDSPLSEPETQAASEDIEAFGPWLIVVLHSSPRGPFVNFDGPAERLAGQFVAGARMVDPRWRIEPDMGYATPGSMGSRFGRDLGIPILTIEIKRGDQPAITTPAVLEGLMALVP